MDAKGSNVSTSFTRDPEDSHITLFIKVEHLQLVDVTDTELLLNSGDQWRSLEASTSQRVKGLFKLLNLVELSVQFNNRNVLLTSGLLGLN